MKRIFADLHIHIGRTEEGHPVKISGSRDLTFHHIAMTASERKGIALTGIIDCHSPVVQKEIDRYLQLGEMEELAGGGIRFGATTILLGSEIEVRAPDGGMAHMLVFLPTLADMRSFTAWMSGHMKNVNLSSQRLYVSARELQRQAADRGGLFIPAHVFTPFKGLYGSCTDRMANVLDPDLVSAVELGLSADTAMAGLISELDRFPFLTNSDAHSLDKIAREYNELEMNEPTFTEFALLLKGEGGRRVAANYGLNPRLGKYHRSFCRHCGTLATEEDIAAERCPACGSTKLVRGVMDRIASIADRSAPGGLENRPPYINQVPLEYIPGLGKAKRERLFDHFGTEMNVLHAASEAELAEVVGAELASLIVRARTGRLNIGAGGGGRYGSVIL